MNQTLLLILSGLVTVMAKTGWLRHWRWSLLSSLLNLLMGAVVGGLVSLTLFLSVVVPRTTETWGYTDPSGVEWHCSRAVGTPTLCTRHAAGTLSFLRDGQPIFSDCTITHQMVR